MDKILPSQKVSPPNGPIGTYPQRTAPNPSQRGMNAPAEPPSHRQFPEPFQPISEKP
jgi:hypothetical protein